MAGSKRSRAVEVSELLPPDVVPAGPSGPQSVSLADVQIGRPFREDGIRQECVEALMASPERWGPIAVRPDGTVVDGRHRVLAARRLGLSRIPAVRVDGDERVGLAGIVQDAPPSAPVSTRDRHIAVRRILCSHPEWADRRIGDLCGISPKTVARIRARMRETFGREEIDAIDVRVGRDGRARPLDAAAKRERIVEALVERPDASLRSIARAIGVSPETVRSVRAKLAEPAPPLSPPPSAVGSAPRGPHMSNQEWNADNAFASREDSAVTAQFFDRTAVDDAELALHVAAVPLSRVYEVADDARRRAVFWTRLAERVEARAKRRSC